MITLTDSERAVCASNPGQIALLHLDTQCALKRAPISILDCGAGTLSARLFSTSSYAVATLDDPMAVTLRIFVPVNQQRNGG